MTETDMRLLLIAAFSLLAFQAANAEEPSGCDKFKFPVAAEQAALSTSDKPTLALGGALQPGKAMVLHLVPSEQAGFVVTPERPPKSGTFGGVVKFSPASAGQVTLALSAGAWVDLVQNGATVQPTEHSGVKDCPNIRKALKFDVSAGEVTLQLSNAAAPDIALVIGAR
jgi:hypothetical protein